MTERDYYIALNSFIPFGSYRTKLLVDYFGSARRAFLVSENKLTNVGLGQKLASQFVEFRNNFSFDGFSKSLRRVGASTITTKDDNYPKNLKGLSDAPPVLFLRGKLRLGDINAIAIVGSRKMSYYGAEVTKKISSELAGFGVTIVSGLAFGVDVTAHKSALEAKGRAIAVLGSGIDLITPLSNKWLGEEILKKGGAILSEYPPGTPAQKYFFPYRNRIISGLSRGVVVIEGMIKSGTIHTARHAANQGKVVFAVPGQITSPTSAAPLFLIKEGAKVVAETSDILEELDMQIRVGDRPLANIIPTDKLEGKIYGILERGEAHIDEVARILGLKVGGVSAKLTVMELKGLIKNLGGGMYKKS